MMSALAYSVKGYPIFPCHWIMDNGECSCDQRCGSPGKHPLTRTGVLDATSDQVQVRKWWSQYPRANIGLACGEPSNIYVIDLDGEVGIESWDAACNEHGAAPTLTVKTGGGGRHLYYHLPAGVNLKNTAKKLGLGIDTRGTGGYVLMPPSNHKSGQRYEWLGGEARVVPQWVVDRMQQQEYEKPEWQKVAPLARAQDDDDLALRILDEECQLIRTTPEGSRNINLFVHSAKVLELAFGGELTLNTALNALEAAGLSCGLEQKEVRQALESAIKHARQQPRRIRTRMESEYGR